MTKKKLGEEKVYVTYKSITEENQNRRSSRQEPGGRKCSRDHRSTLLTGLQSLLSYTEQAHLPWVVLLSGWGGGGGSQINH